MCGRSSPEPTGDPLGCGWLFYSSRRLNAGPSSLVSPDVKDALQALLALRCVPRAADPLGPYRAELDPTGSYLPGRDAAISAYEVLVGTVRAQTSAEPSAPSDSLFAPLDEHDRASRRFARSFHTAPLFAWAGPKFGVGLSLYHHLLPTDVREHFIRVLNDLDIPASRSYSGLASALKSLSGFAKKWGESWLPSMWKYFVNLENLGGYQAVLDPDAFVADLRAWATGDRAHMTVGPDGVISEAAFLDDFRAGLSDFFSALPSVTIANERAMTIDEFSRDPNIWARSGSSSYRQRVAGVDAGGRTVHAKRTKQATAMMRSPGEVASAIRTYSRQENVAVEKPEAAKVRAVVASDDETYLRMAYISHWLEAAMAGSTTTTLYMNQRQVIAMWDRLVSERATSRGWAMPLDQSHFDWQPNKRMITCFFSVLRDVLNAAPARVRPDLLTALGHLEKALTKDVATLRIPLTGEVLPVEKGIMSGWRWTALMDTAFNWAEMWSARMLISRCGLGLISPTVVAQGDDDAITAERARDVVALALAYRVMSFEVNPGKFFVSQVRDEYLRKVAEGGVLSGYPARSLNSILWRNPKDPEPLKGLLRARELSSQWGIALGRGFSRVPLLECAVRDISASNGLTHHEVECLMGTPCCMGGLGWHFGSAKWLCLAPGSADRAVRLDEHALPGLQYVVMAARGLRNVEWRDLEVDVSARLHFEGASVTVVPGGVKEVAKRGYRPVAIGSGPKLGPTVSRDIPQYFASSLLEHAIRERDFSWIHSVYVDASDRSLSYDIERRGGRAVWFAWLRHKLPYAAAFLPGMLGALVSEWSTICNRAAWAAVLRRSAFTMADITGSALSAEAAARSYLLARSPPLFE